MPGNSELEYINHLKGKLKCYLKLLDIDEISGLEHGYALDDDNRVIGLNLSASLIGDVNPITMLRNLTHLDLSDNRIININDLEKIGKLKRLFLSGNRVSSIKALKKLENLEWLFLHRNPIKNYAPLEGLKNLTRLSLAFNDLTDVSFLRHLTRLEYLDLSHNKLKNVSFLANLKKLSYLNLNNNQVSEIACLNEMKHLTRLDLRNNRIHRLPHKLLNRGLRISWKDVDTDGILLYNNPLGPPPREIEEKGNFAVNVYLRSLFKEKITINELKVLLIGDGGVGKTTLAKRICGENINIQESMTPGVNIKYWETMNRDEPVKVNIWDFGGQEVMHSTHKFFLSERSLYILVLDGRRDEKPKYWLNHIKYFGKKSPVLVVLNKIDENPNYDVDRKTLLKDYPNIKGFYRVSCTKKTGLKAFIKNFRKAFEHVGMLNIEWPVNWITVKTQLEDSEEPYISYERYREICRNQNILKKKDQDVLLGYLHDLGVMLHFDDLNLLGTKVLEPEWVTNGVYKIINSNLVKRRKGILELELLPEILLSTMDSSFEIPPEMCVFFIELMKKFKLCYIRDQHTVLLPDILQEPEPNFRFDEHSSIHLVFQYEFLHRHVMTNFMASMLSDNREDLRWRKGVVLQNPSFRANALVKADYDSNKISIYVNGQDKQGYLSVIRYWFEIINRGNKEINVTERVYLPQEPDISVSLPYLHKLLKAGHTETMPEGSLRNYSVFEIFDLIDSNSIPKIDRKSMPAGNSISPQMIAATRWALEKLIEEIRDEKRCYLDTSKKIRKTL